MKLKRILSCLIITLSLLANIPDTANAAPSVVLNGNKLSFDVPPVIENGRTLVPLRTIFEALGADISWDNPSQTVTAVRGDTTITLQIGASSALKNSQPVNLDVPGKIVAGRTMVPLRFVSEAMGCKVAWSSETEAIVVTDNNSASDSLVFSDSRGRFALVYPKGWLNSGDAGVDCLLFAPGSESISDNFNPNINIMVHEFPDQAVSMEWIKSYTLETEKSIAADMNILSEEDIIINGKPAFQRQFTWTYQDTLIMTKATFLYNKDFIYEITVTTLPSENPSLLVIMDQVVRSIRIVEF